MTTVAYLAVSEDGQGFRGDAPIAEMVHSFPQPRRAVFRFRDRRFGRSLKKDLVAPAHLV